jgi:DNA-binding Xre family transcriptional regulator
MWRDQFSGMARQARYDAVRKILRPIDDILSIGFYRNVETNMLQGKRIKTARLKAGLTQVQLAKEAGLPQGHISKLEHNDLNIKRVRVETLEKLCDVLQVTPNDLLDYQQPRRHAR